MFLMFLFVWVLIGATGWIFWKSREFDVTVGDLFLSPFIGFGGPFIWILGIFMVENKLSEYIEKIFSHVIINRRK